MPFDYTYQSSMTGVGQIARSDEAGHVRIKALAILVRELSPANPKHLEISRALGPQPSPNPTFPERPLTPSERKEFHLHPIPADLAAPAPADATPADDEENTEEEDDPF